MLSREINENLVYLSELSQTKKIVLGPDNYTFYGTYYNYMDKNIKYEYTSEVLENATPIYFGALYKVVEEEVVEE